MISQARKKTLPLLAAITANKKMLGIITVVLVLIITASSTVFSLLHPRETQYVQETTGNIRKITTAIELYNAQINQYPSTGLVTRALFSQHNAKASDFIETIPQTPKTHSFYQYDTDGNGQYTIIDPDTYDATYLNAFQKATPPVNGVTSFEQRTCNNNCIHIGYANQNNDFGF
jgi:type II secretory pathway pseudopilin PulG